jgi:hypothetical protein
MIWTVPFVAFAIFPFVKAARSIFRKTSRGHLPGNDLAELNWLVLTLGGTFLAAFVFLMVFFWVAMRYLADFMPFLLTLSLIGFWQGYQLLSEKPAQRRLYTAVAVSVACYSMVSSTLLAISVNDAQFVLMRLFPFLG